MIVNGVQVSTIIFDWSGTLSDDREMVYQANLAIRRRHGKPMIDFDTFIEGIKMTAPEALSVLGIPGTKEELQKLYTKAVEQIKQLGVRPTAYRDAAATLEHLASVGVTTAVLSSHPEGHVRDEATAFGLTRHFHTIAGDCHDKAVGIWETLAQMGITDRASVIYVGDTVYDIRAAKLAGVVSAAVSTGYMNSVRLLLEEPDLFFYQLADMLQLF